MTTQDLSGDKEVQLFVRKTLLRALLGIGILLVLGAILFFYFDDEIKTFTHWTVNRFGFAGMALIVFVADSLITPFPPDIILVIIAKSELANNWLVYVGILGSLSVVGGNLGAFLGRKLGNTRWAKGLVTLLSRGDEKMISRLGFWAVVLGAATPLPFSITTWTAGFIGMKKRLVFFACLVRIPRYYIYYVLIAYSDYLGQLLG